MQDVLDQIRRGDLPSHAKRAVVQGVLPLESEDLITAIYLICVKDEALLGDARNTFDSMPDGVKDTFFEKRGLDADLLHFFLVNFFIPPTAKSAALLNPDIRGDTLAAIAPSLEPELLDLTVNNQVKIQEEPSIVEALRRNPGLTVNQKQKLDDYERLLLKEIVSPAEELESLSIREIEEAAIAEAKEFVRVFGKERESEKPKTHVPEVSAVADEALPARAAESEAVDHRNQKMSVLEKLSNMTVPQKIQAAIKGDREIRSILVRDSNKLVCTAVIRSPRITDAEVEFYSNLRNVQQDVLRLITMNREWMKNYKIVHNLIKNPRTPIGQSIRLLPRLHKKDLKNLVRDRGVPEALRTMARKRSVGR